MEVTPEQLCDEVMILLNTYKADFSDVADSCNLTKVQLFALYAIGKHGELPMGQVAGVLHCDASNVTGIVDRLVAQDLVVRKESPKDRRTKTLRLTKKGAGLVAQAKAAMPERMCCDKLDAAERQQLSALIQKLRSYHSPAMPCPCSPEQHAEATA